MASTYAISLASVPVDQIDRIRRHHDSRAHIDLVATRVEHCPHDLTGIELFPLGTVLAEAVDIGQPLRNDGWHPLRAPIVIDPETVTARAMRLDAAYGAVADELGGMMAEVLGADIKKVIDLYAHASARGEAVVSFLSAPTDHDQASATLVPQVRLG